MIKTILFPADTSVWLKIDQKHIHFQDFWRHHKESTVSEPLYEPIENYREHVAANKIQLAVRRWLNKRRKDQLAKSQPFLNRPITEERAMKLQQEIDAWQHHHKVPPMTSAEFADLHHKAQMKYAKFCQNIVATRRREQKISACIAQSKNIVDILESKPDLHSYNADHDWKRFHSLPLHIATKARLDHNEAMLKLDMPSWKRLLSN